MSQGEFSDATVSLGRTLKPRHVEMIAIGGIIGAGLFVGSSASIATVGPAVVVSYAIAGAIILMLMRMISEMAVANPGVSSFAEFIRIGLGNFAGFLSGWLYWYFWVVVVAIEAIAGAAILALWLPFETWQIGLVLLALLTGVNLMSTRSYGEFEFWLSSLKVGAIVAFIAIAASYAFGWGPATEQGALANLTVAGGFAPFGVMAVLAGVTSVIFALVGAEIATIAAAESAEPAKVIARLTGSVALRILLFYIVSIALIVIVVPWNEIEPGVSPFAVALERMAIPGAATIMNVIVLIAVLSCLNSGLYVTSRVLFTLAARGDAPQWIVKVNHRQVPVRSILIGSLFGYVALGASIASPEVVFGFLVNASGALMLFIYLMVCFAQIRLRNRVADPGRLAVKMWFHPWGAILVIVAICGVLLAMALTPALASQFYSSAVITLLCAALYPIRLRNGAAVAPGFAVP